MDPQTLVDGFIEAWNRRDLDAILACFADDAVYHNIPMEPLRGIDEIRTGVEGFIGMAERIDWQVLTTAASTDGASGTVLNERIDRFEIGGKMLELAVMGSFEINGGRITAWRDYFDLGQFQRQMDAITGAS